MIFRGRAKRSQPITIGSRVQQRDCVSFTPYGTVLAVIESRAQVRWDDAPQAIEHWPLASLAVMDEDVAGMMPTDELIAVVAAGGGPQWQALTIGDRVTPIDGRKRGTVMEVSQRSPASGITTHVSVCWSRARRFTEIWPTDCLVVVSETKESAS